MELSGLKTVAICVMCVAASWTDVRNATIPNVITVTGFCCAVLFGVAGVPFGIVVALTGALLAAAVSIPFYALRALGGGDAKLLIAVGAFLGPSQFAVALAITALAGGLLALGFAARRRVLLPLLLSSRDLIVYWITLGRQGSRPALNDPHPTAIPYGVAIAIGAIAGTVL